MSFSNPQPIVKTTVILKSPADWDEWILVVNLMADNYVISDDVDLTIPEKQKPKEPSIPDFSHVKEGAMKFSDLDATRKRNSTCILPKKMATLCVFSLRSRYGSDAINERFACYSLGYRGMGGKH